MSSDDPPQAAVRQRADHRSIIGTPNRPGPIKSRGMTNGDGFGSGTLNSHHEWAMDQPRPEGERFPEPGPPNMVSVIKPAILRMALAQNLWVEFADALAGRAIP